MTRKEPCEFGKITEELKHNAEWYEVLEGSPVEVQWAVRWVV